METLEAAGFQRFALLLEYNGTHFSGSQCQRHSGQRTVQQTLNDAFLALGFPAQGLHLASRTDAGVHARGQVAQLWLPRAFERQVPAWHVALNAHMPEDAQVRQLRPTTPEFHAQRDARWKWYRYTVLCRTHRDRHRTSLWDAADTAHMFACLNVAAMQAAQRHLQGVNRYGSFQRPGAARRDDHCHVAVFQVQAHPEPYLGQRICFDVVGNRFLYGMVRLMVGALLAVGQGRMRPEDVARFAAMQDFRAASAGFPQVRLAPPSGLCLMAIAYARRAYPLFEDCAWVRALEAMLQEAESVDVRHLILTSPQG
jgi:tRNA pseudouridine38-40 synthase